MNKNFPIVDHGIDIIGDEWDVDDEEPEMSIKLVKHYDPKHPYCTNWPMSTSRSIGVQKTERETD
ncbi:MAG: hypothetical protein QGH83_13920 [Candidatus Pacebacteria bacterium]|jgi:hypothetical protein|nr:hypothetical protein [Candidatus Paceibacterota bacterium]|tara:strand:- start:79 stop:273 length:195 start_codon:yes stop_codon:yes gene_type:complete